MDWRDLPLDGDDGLPRWAGDTLPLAVTILGPDGLDYMGVVTAARCELLQIVGKTAVPLGTPVAKTLGAGITWAAPVLTIWFQPADTKDLPAAVYGYATRVASADLGERTLGRRIKLQARPFALA